MKRIWGVLGLFILSIGVFSQNDLGKAEDFGRISLSVIDDESLADLPKAEKNILANKLKQVATMNGLGAATFSQFYISAAYTVINKEVIPGAPTQYLIEGQITLFMGDFVDNKIFASSTFTSKGAGVSEAKAFSSLLKSINPSSPQCRKFIQSGKEKILEYYNSQCEFILRKTKSLAETNQYEKALFILLNIPEVCKDCYFAAQKEIKPLYQQYINKRCPEYLNKARNAWLIDQSYTGAENAAEYLNKMDPEAGCFPEAQKLAQEIAEKIKKTNDKVWTCRIQQYNDSVELEKLRIEAVRQIGVAYGENQQPTTINMNKITPVQIISQ